MIHSHYKNGDNKKVVIEAEKILENYPNNFDANHLLGRALTDLKKYTKAIPYLDKLTNDNHTPKWIKSWSYGYLGVCHFATDEPEKSKKCLQLAILENGTKNSTSYANKRLKWFQMTNYFDDWTIIETVNIRFHIQPNHSIKNVQKYCNNREEAYNKNNGFFKARPYKKIDFYAWSNPIEGKLILDKAVGFANSNLCIINSRIDQTLGHEITHILCDSGIKPKIKNRLINEGICVMFDLSKRDRFSQARSVNLNGLKVKELLEKADKLPDNIIYPLGGALIKFLYDKGDNDKLKSLLKEQTWENLLELYGTQFIEEFENLIIA